MNIGQIANETGLPAKTLRYYEEIGLIQPGRDANGYRVFTQADAHKLIFLGRARALGFSIEECRKLLALYEDKDRASSDVKALAQGHLSDIEEKIRQLEDMRATLSNLVDACAGDHRPDCPILTGLSQN
ncbi:MAG: Cu(I)-responsive transcriptional regulator [Pseudomonadota bacterium]